MKKFFVILLILIVLGIGYLSTAYYFIIPKFQWYHILLLLGSHIITVPAIIFWKNYFYDLFFTDEFLKTYGKEE